MRIVSCSNNHTFTHEMCFFTQGGDFPVYHILSHRGGRSALTRRVIQEKIMSDQRYRSRLITLRSQINANFDRLIGQATLANEDQEGSLIER